MRILFVVDVAGNLGDIIRVARIHQTLRKSGTDVVLTNLKECYRPRIRMLSNPGMVASVFWTTMRNGQLGKSLAQSRLYVSLVEKKLAKAKPDLVWCEGIILGGTLAPLCKKHGIPLVTDVHGLASAEYGENHFRPQSPACLEYILGIETQAVEGSDVLITVSNPMSEYFLQRGARSEQIACMPNGAEVQSRRAEYRDPLKVIYAGALSFWEDVDTFLDAGKLAADQTFYLAGSGYLESHLKRRIRTENIRVHYLGNVPRHRIMEVFADMQVGIAPSTNGLTRRVACPIKVFDYLACGLPVITPDVGEWASVIREHRCGIVTHSSNGEEFSHALEQLRVRKTWEEMSHNGVAMIRNTCNWDRILEPIPSILDRF